VFASRRGVADVIDGIPGPLIHLREGGKDIRGVEIPRDVAFVLSDSIELTGEEEAVVARRRVAVCSVGPVSVHTGDAIAIVHNEMDRRHPV
jgi:tRNA pseudouridine-54 N-methylase